MKLKELFQSKSLWLNLAGMLGITLVFLTTVTLSLNWYTDHGLEIPVPKVVGLDLENASKILESKSLRYKIVDSVFVDGMKPNQIVEQDPLPDMSVKEERIVYLTITKGNAPKVRLPNLVDMTLRQATQVLQNAGFALGQVIPRTDLATNVILETQYHGLPQHAGKLFPRGTAVDLVVGVLNADSLVLVPDLTGLTAEEARIMLYESSLNLGSIFYDGPISDTASALVIKQRPSVNPEELINAATLVDIWLGDAARVEELKNSPKE